MNWLPLLEMHVWYFLLIVGAAAMFFSLFRVIDLAKGKCEPRAAAKWLPLSIGGLFVCLGVLFFFFKDRLNPYPDLGGPWVYEVRNELGEFSHKGEAFVSGKGESLTIQGTRRWTCVDGGNKGACVMKEVSVPWSTNWAQICNDGNIRFLYAINLPYGRVEGYCTLSYKSGGEPAELAGSYYILPPYDGKLVNARFGEIRFRKMKVGDKLDPPKLGSTATSIQGGMKKWFK